MGDEPASPVSQVGNPLEGLGWPLVIAALGSLAAAVSLSLEWQIVVTCGVSCVCTVAGLATFRRRLHGPGTRWLRRCAGAACLIFPVNLVILLLEYVPGAEPFTALGLVRVAQMAAIVGLQAGMARYTARFKLAPLWATWALAAGVTSLELILGAVLLARAFVGSSSDITLPRGAGIPLLCSAFVPGVLFMWAAAASLRAARRMRGGCVKCGFDIRGLRDNICPECGTRFATERRALATPPDRGPQVPWITIVAVGLFVTLTVGATYWQVPGLGSVSGKPIWLVTRDAFRVVRVGHDHGVDRVYRWSLVGNQDFPLQQGYGAQQAQEELLARIASGKIKGEAASRLADRALDAQADLSRPIGRLGDIFMELAVKGLTRPEQETRYLRQLVRFSLVVRKRVRQGSVLPFEIRAVWRGPNGTTVWGPNFGELSRVQVRVERLEVGGRPQHPLPPSSGEAGSDHVSAMTTWFAGKAVMQPEQMPVLDAPLGDQEVRVWMRLFVPEAERAGLSSFVASGRWPGNAEHNLADRMQVNAPDQPAVRVADDPGAYGLRTTGMNARVLWLVRHACFSLFAGGPVGNSDDHRVLAFEVFFGKHDNDHLVGEMVLAAPYWDGGWLKIPESLEDCLESSSVRVLLYPSVAAAEKSVGGEEVLTGPPIVLDVEIGDKSFDRGSRHGFGNYPKPPALPTPATPAPPAPRSSPPAPAPDRQRR